MVGVDLVDHRLFAQDPADAAEIGAFEVETHRLALRLLGLAELLRLRRVDASAVFAPLALAARSGVTGFSLLLRRGAMRTLNHPQSLSPATLIKTLPPRTAPSPAQGAAV